MPQYTLTRTFVDGSKKPMIGSPVEYRDTKKAIAESDKAALRLVPYVNINNSGTVTLTNPKGKIIATWKIEPDSVNIFGEWRSGYGAQKHPQG